MLKHNLADLQSHINEFLSLPFAVEITECYIKRGGECNEIQLIFVIIFFSLKIFLCFR